MQNDSPLVSVIMPAYNASKYIGQAIDSVLTQTYENWELLICDDGSNDRTLSIIQEFKDVRIHVVTNTKNRGAFLTKNLLIGKAKGSYITFLDADDYMASNRIEQQLKPFCDNPNLGMVGCQVGYVDSHGSVIRKSIKPMHYQDVLDRIYSNNVIGGSIMFIKKSVLNEVGGGFRSYFGRLSYQDYDLSILIAEKFECYNLPVVLYYYRQHGESISKVRSVDRVLAKDVVIHLAKQRRNRGTDDLMEARPELVDEYFNQLREPYMKDPSRIYREFAADFMYAKLYWKAIKTSLRSIAERPSYIKNWRTMLYCIRVSILNFF